MYARKRDDFLGRRRRDEASLLQSQPNATGRCELAKNSFNHLALAGTRKDPRRAVEGLVRRRLQAKLRPLEPTLKQEQKVEADDILEPIARARMIYI